MVGSVLTCCGPAGSGQAAAAPPRAGRFATGMMAAREMRFRLAIVGAQ